MKLQKRWHFNTGANTMSRRLSIGPGLARSKGMQNVRYMRHDIFIIVEMGYRIHFVKRERSCSKCTFNFVWTWAWNSAGFDKE